MKKKKKKKQKISVLKRKLWVVFSLFIRQRDNFTCFICGRKGTGGGIHASHFISKRIGGLLLYFHEDNVHATCYNCNINLGGNLYEYGQKLGEKIIKELYALKDQTEEWSAEDYIDKINHYQKLLENQ